MELILPEELMLIGRTAAGHEHGSSTRLAVAAGVIGELALQRRIMIDGSYAFVTDPTATRHPLLDKLFGELVQRRTAIRLTSFLREQARLYEMWLNQLIAGGLLRPEAASGSFASTRYVPDPKVRNSVLSRLWYLLTVALAGIVHGSDLGDDLIPFPADRATLAVFGQRDPVGQAIGAVHVEDRSAAAGMPFMVLSVPATPAGCTPLGGC
ncbi:GOLPH3/VPS74 family protein [Saccharopolyspora spinosa]|uniref:GOLPH3/VPS74 family protein n=1 Tax=Saccharopolyspora spinosa TaxID=60894 RepID=UPI0002378D03|nr:GPP34 family phosphoprotein [Saccharopolyspora spinosa]